MDNKATLPFLKAVKNLRIPCQFTHYPDGTWGCWTRKDTHGIINTYGLGNSLEEAIDDYLDALKEIATCIFEDEVPEKNASPEFVVKMLVSPKQEIKSCLDGKICDDF